MLLKSTATNAIVLRLVVSCRHKYDTRPMLTLLHVLNIPSVCHSAYTVCTRFDIHQPNLEQCIAGKRKVHSRRPVPSRDADVHITIVLYVCV